MPRKKTLEEREKEKQERLAKNLADIEEDRERKRLERIEKGRLTPQDAQRLATARARLAGLPEEVALRDIRAPETAEEIQQAKLIKGKAGFGEELEQAGAFEDVTPREVELSPDLKTDVPVITPTLGAASQFIEPRPILVWARDKGWLGDFFPEKRTGEEAFAIPETPETLREAALRQISINAFNEDTTRAEKFGALMELLPAFGAIDQWVQGVIESPHENALDVIAELKDIGEQATNSQEKTASGVMPASFAMNRARDMENDVAELEGRLKLLINQSKILQANPDQVNLMEEQILDAKIRIDNFRTAASFALTAEITGTGRVIPTDEQLFFELKGNRKV